MGSRNKNSQNVGRIVDQDTVDQDTELGAVAETDTYLPVYEGFHSYC